MTTPAPDADRKLDVIRKLLAKAERAATTEEAEAYTAKATDLMLRYSIDEAVLDRNPGRPTTDTVDVNVIMISGYPLPKATLLAGIAQTFGCKVIRTNRSGGSDQIFEVWGFKSDLLAVDTLYASLIIQADRELARAVKPAYEHGRSFKTSFLTGFANTVFNRLADQRKGLVRETENTNPGTALALRNRTVAVQDGLAAAHPHTSKTGGPSVTSRAGLNSGRDAGNRADLGQTRINAGGRRALGR